MINFGRGLLSVSSESVTTEGLILCNGYQMRRRRGRCLKQQSIEVDPKHEKNYAMAYLVLMAETMAGYIRHGFGGTFIPTLYRRNKSNGLEIGIAYFGKPSPTGIEASSLNPSHPMTKKWGTDFHDVSPLLSRAQESSTAPIFLRPVSGLDIRKSSHLDGIQVQMIAQKNFICVHTELNRAKYNSIHSSILWTERLCPPTLPSY